MRLVIRRSTGSLLGAEFSPEMCGNTGSDAHLVLLRGANGSLRYNPQPRIEH